MPMLRELFLILAAAATWKSSPHQKNGAVEAFSSSPSPQRPAVPAGGCRSPWAPSQWRIILDVGAPPPGRGSSESNSPPSSSSSPRLVISLDVSVESDRVDPPPDDPIAGGRGSSLLRALSVPTYVTMGGERTVPLEDGGWKIDLPPDGTNGARSGRASSLIAWLDIPEGAGAERNGATLPGGGGGCTCQPRAGGSGSTQRE